MNKSDCILYSNDLFLKVCLKNMFWDKVKNVEFTDRRIEKLQEGIHT